VAGYAACARLQGARTQFAVSGGHAFRSTHSAPTEASLGSDGGAIEQLELAGRPIGETVADWLASVGESWSQLTFFLFDPDSWR
jgi:hypothetical protein